MMKLKLIAVVVLVASAGASATTVDLGIITGTSPIGNTVTGLFADTFNFEVGVPGQTFTANAVNTSFSIVPPGITLGNIGGFSGVLDGSLLTWESVSTPISPGITQVIQTLATTGMALSMGPHSLVITGTADPGSTYSGSISTDSIITVVPEPEAYAMLLVGLGALGVVARRTH